jgi:uncharacterized protein (DUF433 family)
VTSAAQDAPNTPATSHVRVDDDGVAWVDDTRVKVVEVVMDQLAHGWSPEEIHFQHPNLSLAQIHAAFAWYYDHQSQLDAEIEASVLEAERRGATTVSPLRRRLRAAGLLP